MWTESRPLTGMLPKLICLGSHSRLLPDMHWAGWKSTGSGKNTCSAWLLTLQLPFRNGPRATGDLPLVKAGPSEVARASEWPLSNRSKNQVQQLRPNTDYCTMSREASPFPTPLESQETQSQLSSAVSRKVSWQA